MLDLISICSNIQVFSQEKIDICSNSWTSHRLICGSGLDSCIIYTVSPWSSSHLVVTSLDPFDIVTTQHFHIALFWGGDQQKINIPYIWLFCSTIRGYITGIPFDPSLVSLKGTCLSFFPLWKEVSHTWNEPEQSPHLNLFTLKLS